MANKAVRCEFNGADPTGKFVDGRVYHARHVVNALYTVIDELGIERFIIPDEPSPHLPRTLAPPLYGHRPRSVSAGKFVTVTPRP